MGRMSQWIGLGVCHKHAWNRRQLLFLFRWSACDCHCNTKTKKLWISFPWHIYFSCSWITSTLFKQSLLVSGHVLLSVSNMMLTSKLKGTALIIMFILSSRCPGNLTFEGRLWLIFNIILSLSLLFINFPRQLLLWDSHWVTTYRHAPTY